MADLQGCVLATEVWLNVEINYFFTYKPITCAPPSMGMCKQNVLSTNFGI